MQERATPADPARRSSPRKTPVLAKALAIGVGLLLVVSAAALAREKSHLIQVGSTAVGGGARPAWDVGGPQRCAKDCSEPTPWILDTMPPTISLKPWGGTFASESVFVQILWCDTQSYPSQSSMMITLDGVDQTAAFDFKDTSYSGPNCRLHKQSTGKLLVRSVPGGTGKFVAHICDSSSNHWCSDTVAYFSYSLPPRPRGVSVTPDFQQLDLEPHGSQITTFTVTNTVSQQDTFVVKRSCSGTAVVSGCSAPSDTLILAALSAANVAVSYTTNDTIGKSGSLRVSAYSLRSTATTDTGSVNVTVVSPGTPGVDVVSQNAGTTLERSLCLNFALGDAASECGDLRLVHSAPALVTLGKARAPVLLYNSNHAHPLATVLARVTLPNDGVVPQQVSARLIVGGVERANGSWSGTGWSAGTGRRIALSYDARSDSTGVYSYLLEVTRQYATSTAKDTARGSLIVVNRAASPFGSGWWLAGYERLYFPKTDTILWVAGDGSARVYAKQSGTSIWRAPNLDRRDSLIYDSAAGVYRRNLPHRIQVVFSGTGVHQRTIGSLGDTTVFFTTGARVDSIRVPVPSGAPLRQFWMAYGSPAGTLSSIRTTDGATGSRYLTINADNVGRITSFRDPDSSYVSFSYDPTVTERVTSRTDRRQTQSFFTYAAGGSLASTAVVMSSTDTIRTLYHDRRERGRSGTAPVASLDDYSTLDGPRTDVGDSTMFWTDGRGAVTRMRDAIGNETLVSRADASWPAAVTRVQYADGHVIGASYDSHGNLATSTDSSTYRDNGTTRTYATSRYVWDPTCDYVLTATPPEDSASTFHYDANCRRDWQQRVGDTTQFFYNTLRLPIAVRTSNGAVDSVGYDALGNVSWTRTPLGYRTTYLKDGLGRDTLVISPAGGTRQLRQRYAYDSEGRDTLTVTSGDQDTLVVRTHFDAEGMADSISQLAKPDRNNLGWVVHALGYDRLNRKTGESTGGIGRTYFYDPAGNVIRDGDLGNVARTYDAANRLVRRVGTYTEDFSYDAVGHLVTANNEYAQVRRAYNRNGTLASETQRIETADSTTADFTKHVYTVSYSYDLTGRKTSVGVAGSSTKYTYDPTTGQLATVTDASGMVHRFHYDRMGRPDSLIRRDGLTDRIVETRSYDLESQLIGRRITAPSATIHQDSLFYDNRGKVVSAWHLGSPCDTSVYNALGQLTDSQFCSQLNQEGSYVSDAMGNRLSGESSEHGSTTTTTSLYKPGTLLLATNVANNWTSTPDTSTYTYNGRGDLTYQYLFHYLDPDTVSAPTGGYPVAMYTEEATESNYDAIGRLIWTRLKKDTVHYGGDLITPPYFSKEAYRYDALGRRVWTRIVKPSNCVYYEKYSNCKSTIVRAVWDGNQILKEYRAEGSDTATASQWENDNGASVFYSYGEDLDVPLTVSGMLVYSNWRGLPDQGTCPVAACTSDIHFAGAAMTAYGGGAHLAGGSPSWHGSLIEAQTDASGLQYKRNRYYDPTTGRFTQVDPIGIAGGLNVYGYANGDPITYADPFGLCPDPNKPWCSSPGYHIMRFFGVSDATADAIASIGYSGAMTVAGSNVAMMGPSFFAGAKVGVPDDAIVVRGGQAPVPPPGEVFSGAAGSTLEEAASGVPHGTIRATTAGEIRRGGGTVESAPEQTRSGTMNEKHVNICLGTGSCPFREPQPNPVPKAERAQ